MLQRLLFSAGVVATTLLASCTQNTGKTSDSMTAGKINVAVDETFKPVIEEQLKVFHSSFPEAHITGLYHPEADCIKDLLNDSARVALVTRELNAEEKEYCKTNKIVTRSLDIAKDAVTFITNKSVADPKFTVNDIKQILTGAYNKPYTLVFDNQRSSTVRYVMDSLIPGQKLSDKIYAANGCAEVVDYVAKNPEAIGVIGVSWVSDPSDSVSQTFLNQINVASIQNPKDGQYYQPYQAYIAMKSYPFTRTLYFISRETWVGLGTGFVNFLSKDRGQLIFKKAMLFPSRMDVIIREVNLNTKTPAGL